MDSSGLAKAVSGARSLEKRPLGRLVSLFEDSRPESRPLRREALELLQDSPKRAVFLGFTGNPGVGKSTLTGALARSLGDRFSVAVLAVDPSSPLSGGSFLGDRTIADKPGIYFRSQASGSSPGGLSSQTFPVCRLLYRLFDLVFIETVGVGQNEIDVSRITDRTYLLLQPSSGDHLQFLKSGIMEMPDAFVISKADLPEAEKTAHILRSTLPLARTGGEGLPVYPVSARDGRGVGELVADCASVSPAPDLRGREAFFFRSWVREEYGRFGLSKLDAGFSFEQGSLEDAMDRFEKEFGA